jgi:hypothetical protein
MTQKISKLRQIRMFRSQNPPTHTSLNIRKYVNATRIKLRKSRLVVQLAHVSDARIVSEIFNREIRTEENFWRITVEIADYYC